MRSLYQLATLVLVFIIGIDCYSQTGYLDHFKNYTVEDGLPSNSVYSVCEDEFGFIWIATADGLCKFDGYGFKIYRNLGVYNSNRKNFFRKIFRSKQGDLWIGMEHGITRFDQKTGKFNNKMNTGKEYQNTDLLISTLSPYYQMQNGNILVTTSVHGNFQINIHENTLTPLFGNNSPLQMADPVGFDENGICFVKNDSIYLFHTKNQKWEYILTTSTENNLLQKDGVLQNNILYLCQGSLIKKIDLGTKTITSQTHIPIDYEGIDQYTSIERTPNNLFIFTTKGNGMTILDADLNLLYHFKSDRKNKASLQSDIIECTYFDSHRHLWIGTDLGGVSCLPFSNRFSNNFYETLKGKFISCIYREGDFIYAGIYNQGLIKMNMRDKKTSQVYLLSTPKNIRAISSINGKLIIGSEMGIIEMDISTGTDRIIQPLNQHDNSIRYFLKTGNRLVAASSSSAYSISVNDNGIVVNVLPGKFNLSMFVNGFNNELIGCSKTMINDTTRDQKSPYFIQSNGQSYLEGALRAIKHNDEMWMAATDGLIRLDKNYFPTDTFGDVNSMLKTRIMSMELYKDQIWISCNNHLFMFDITTRTFHPFDAFDGLTSIEFVSNSSHIDNEGYLYFGSIDGFVRFHPDSVYLYTQVRKPMITQIKVFDKVYTDSSKQFIDSLYLSHNNNTLFVEFSSPDPVFQNRIKYAYQLNNGKWIEIGEAHSFWLSNLQPGKYSLNIKATSADGVWGEPHQILIIYITPPFWQTWWFISLLILISAGILIVAIYKISTIKQRKKIDQLKKQEALNNERMRISKDLHDELGSGLSKIKFLSDLVLQEQNKEEQLNKLESISRTSDSVVNNMKELIWLMNSEDTNLNILAASIREYANDYLEEFNIEIKIHFPDHLPVVSISKNVYRHLYMIIKECLQNIVKHSKANEVTLELELNDMLVIRIKDNGKGFDQDQAKGNGLKNINDRMLSINGEYKLVTAPEKGTMVEISINQKNLDPDQIPL